MELELWFDASPLKVLSLCLDDVGNYFVGLQFPSLFCSKRTSGFDMAPGAPALPGASVAG